MAKNIEDIYDLLTISDSEYPELVDEIVEKTWALIEAIKSLRSAYKNDGKLPLYHINTDHENMMTIVRIIEDEALKFGIPMSVSKTFTEKSPEQIEEIKQDKLSLMDSGLDEWIEEGLLK